MPSIHASDISQDDGHGKVWVMVVGALLVCGVGFGVYHFGGGSTQQVVKPVAMAVKPEISAELKKRHAVFKAAQAQKEQQAVAALGLTNAQITQLSDIEKNTTSPREQASAIQKLLTSEQWTKYQEQHPQMRWGGGGWGGPGGGPNGQGRGGRGRRGGDGQTSGQQQASEESK
jgi:hypothetical protein